MNQDDDHLVADSFVIEAIASALAEEDGAAARRAAGEARERLGGEPVLDNLARSAAEGSELAVEILVELLDELGLARKAVRSFLVDESSVDDVTQETLISVAKSVSSFRGASKFTTWLHRIARNRSVDHLRRLHPTAPIDDAPLPVLRISSVVASRESLRRLLDRLPDRYRIPVTLRDVEGLPYAEVAARLGRKVNTVKAQVARGRSMLAGMIDESGLQ